MSRAELAEAVNDYLWRTEGKAYALDGHTIARYERGRVRWPNANYRAGLRAILRVADDAGLGFHPTPRGSSAPPAPDRERSEAMGTEEFSPSRSSYPRSGFGGSAKTAPAAPIPAAH
ncbi:hypothetical protein EKD16_21855 [Streptomonospora litoralis]|uniref:Uncharacterized protein n=2 Tax=Streptomonospora litoralis TaxID=2498135 RepID=A0A4P6Q9X0_9ACTN|nr:hypothetical protein EKD16_21855 [Streptomonospora litoralis]